MRRIGLVTGGGDCPGLNAVVRAVVKRAAAMSMEVVGLEDAFRGILEPGRQGYRVLDQESISGILARGGTILGTSNRANPFIFPVMQPDGRVVEQDLSRQLVERLSSLGIEGLVVAGGDGSLDICRRLGALGLRTIGVPKTIDNDLSMTDQTFGFDTARNIATEAVDRLHTTADSHDRVMILELMGRNSGFLSLEAGLAGGADIILLPEIPYDPEAVVKKIRSRMARGRTFSIAVVAEGAYPRGGEVAVAEAADATPGRGVVRLGGAGKQLADLIADRVELEVRVTVLGHLQRGGIPSAFDRLLGTRMGAHAMTLVDEDRWDRVVVLRGQSLTDVPLTEEVTRQKQVDPAGELCQTARQLGICLGE